MSDEITLKNERGRFIKGNFGRYNPFYNRHHTEETKNKIRNSKYHKNLRGKNNPFYGKHHTEKTKIKISKNKNRAKKISKALKGRKVDWIWNKGKKGVQKAWNKNLTKRTDKRVAKYAKTLSEVRKELMKNPELLKKMLSFRKPNKSELFLLGLLQKPFPNEFRFVGNGEVTFDRFNPDFINCNGKKLIIELFGEPWHKSEDEEIRRKIYAKYGYKLLVIWYKELRDPEKIVEKIKVFLNE